MVHIQNYKEKLNLPRSIFCLFSSPLSNTHTPFSLDPQIVVLREKIASFERGEDIIKSTQSKKSDGSSIPVFKPLTLLVGGGTLPRLITRKN
jgi:hypothetical protein